MSDEVYDFGRWLQKARMAAGLSQADVAKRLGITVGNLQKYEYNTALPPVDKLETMALMYRTSLDYLRNLDKRSCIYLDDLPPKQQDFIKSMVDHLREELKAYDSK
jgi:transcriptional regulator with XRE-family HTH domain